MKKILKVYKKSEFFRSQVVKIMGLLTTKNIVRWNICHHITKSSPLGEIPLITLTNFNGIPNSAIKVKKLIFFKVAQDGYFQESYASTKNLICGFREMSISSF